MMTFTSATRLPQPEQTFDQDDLGRIVKIDGTGERFVIARVRSGSVVGIRHAKWRDRFRAFFFGKATP